MPLPPEHPIRQYLDAVASGGRPSGAELDAVVAAAIPDDFEGTTVAPTALRARLVEATRTILAHHEIGHSGDARTVARDVATELAGSLPVLVARQPRADRDGLAEIIAEVPR
jgi:NADH dehydrogenase FAD-containing subunit